MLSMKIFALHCLVLDREQFRVSTHTSEHLVAFHNFHWNWRLESVQLDDETEEMTHTTLAGMFFFPVLLWTSSIVCISLADDQAGTNLRTANPPKSGNLFCFCFISFDRVSDRHQTVWYQLQLHEASKAVTLQETWKKQRLKASIDSVSVHELWLTCSPVMNCPVFDQSYQPCDRNSAVLRGGNFPLHKAPSHYKQTVLVVLGGGNLLLVESILNACRTKQWQGHVNQ